MTCLSVLKVQDLGYLLMTKTSQPLAPCSQPNILIENKRIQQVNQSKSLGITIDQRLSRKPNTENICKKITSGISALCRLKPFIIPEKETLISIYNAIVWPYFDYCSEVWDIFGEV